MLENNLNSIEERIKRACDRSGRQRGEVTLIAVSKTKPAAMVAEAVELGQLSFGENRVQEMLEKQDELMELYPEKDFSALRWHLIGHLQTNKVKYVIGKTVLIHSLDSLHLAEEINRISIKKDVITPVLVEVNIADESTKFGTGESEAIELVKAVSELKNIAINGLMTVAPYTDNPENSRQYFQRMHQLSVDIKAKNIDNVTMEILSMGMTGDFEVAIEEGATHIRVGTGIFGGR